MDLQKGVWFPLTSLWTGGCAGTSQGAEAEPSTARAQWATHTPWEDKDGGSEGQGPPR